MGWSVGEVKGGHSLVVNMNDPDPIPPADHAPVAQGQRPAPVSGEAEPEHRPFRNGKILEAVEAPIEDLIPPPEQVKEAHKIDLELPDTLQFCR